MPTPWCDFKWPFSLGVIARVGSAPSLAKLAKRDGADSGLAWRFSARGRMSGSCSACWPRMARSGRRLTVGDPGRAGQPDRSKASGDDIAAVLKPLAGLAETDKALARELVTQLVSKQPGLASKLAGVDSGQVRVILAELLSEARKTRWMPRNARRPAWPRCVHCRWRRMRKFGQC